MTTFDIDFERKQQSKEELERARKRHNLCIACPYHKYCGLMISCARLVKAGACAIHNAGL